MTNITKIGYPEIGKTRAFNLNGKEYCYSKSKINFENYDLSKLEDFSAENKIVETKLVSPNEIHTRIDVNNIKNKKKLAQIKTLLKIDGEYTGFRVDKSGSVKWFKTNLDREIKDATFEKTNSSDMVFISNLNKEEVLKLLEKAKRLLKRK